MSTTATSFADADRPRAAVRGVVRQARELSGQAHAIDGEIVKIVAEIDRQVGGQHRLRSVESLVACKTSGYPRTPRPHHHRPAQRGVAANAPESSDASSADIDVRSEFIDTSMPDEDPFPCRGC